MKNWEIQRNTIIVLILILILCFTCIATVVTNWPALSRSPVYLMTPTPNIY